jgi:PAS domain S-box-containing protein
MFTKEGAIRWFHDDALLIRDEQGLPMFWQGIMYDITDQRTSDALVRETEDRYRTLVEQLPAIVYSEDVTGDGLQVVYINSRVKELLGIEPEEWVADPSVWAASIHPDDAQMVDDVNRESERLSEPVSVEYRMIARDGRMVWINDEAILVRDDSGQPLYFQGLMFDVTEHHRALEALQKSEENYRLLTENASDFISRRPRLWARRRAGSMVRQRTRLPRRAAARPRAAVVVVLTTPPQPTHRMTRRVSRRGARPRGAPAGFWDERSLAGFVGVTREAS